MAMGFMRRKDSRTAAVEFEDIYRHNLRPVYAYVAYRLSDTGAAEDVTARAFEKAWRAFAGFDPERASVSCWLFTIARNCVIDHLRLAGRHQEAPLEEEDLADAGATPEQQLVDSERNEALRRAVLALDERGRDVVALKFGGGMSNSEIADLLSLTPTNVSTILCRSLEKLKNQLKGGIEND